MEPADEPSSGEDSAQRVELLAGVADVVPSSPLVRRPRWRTTLIVGTVIVLYVGFLWLPNVGDARVGAVHTVDTYFGDPFTIEWIGLAGPGDDAASYPRPPPMASIDPPCVGFGRLDWPESERHPSVAHCVDPEVADRIPDDGVAVLREAVAGANTWYLLLFGGDVNQVEVRIDDSSDLGPERIYQGGPYVALLLPIGYEHMRLSWHISGGDRYECSFSQGSIAAQSCE